METKRLITLIIIIAAVVLLLFRDKFDFGGNEIPDGGGNQEKVAVFVAPTNPDLKNAVQPVRDAVKGKKNLMGLAWFYYRMSVAQKEKPITTEQARMIHKTAGDELSRVAGAVSYHPELEPVLERLFDTYIGKDAKKLTANDRTKISELFAAIAWAIFEEADNKVSVMRLDDGTQLVCTGTECFIDAPKDVTGEKMPDYFVNGLDAMTDEDRKIANELDNFSYPVQEQVNAKKNVKGGRQDDDRGPPIIDGEKYQTGLMFDPTELKAWNESGLMMSEIPLTSGKGKTRLLYEALQEFDPPAYTQERQTTGDCTSHAFRNACDTSRAFEIIVNHETEDFRKRGATEAIYGYRGHSGQGMSPFRAAQFVSQYGGVMIRRSYGSIDASSYNAQLGMNWGRRGGPPKELVAVLKEHQMQKAALVNNVNEARDAIFNGYAIAVGSDYGFESKRDKHGFAAKKGSWMHCMAWVAVSTAKELAGDDWKKYGSEPDSPCFLIVNSWGEWNGGPTGRFDIPAGSFWITEKEAAAMIGQKMSFAVGSFNGFAQAPLKDWGFAYLSTDSVKVTSGGPELNGVVEQAVGVVLELYQPDPTRPDGSEGKDGEDDDGGKTPDKCSRCNGSGWHTPDGVRRPCTGDKGNDWKCPFTSSINRQSHFSLAA